MKSEFRKISRVGSLGGGTKWYLSEDCLLASKRVLYVVEYRRFYLCDLEYVTVCADSLWLWRVIIPAVLLATLGASLWQWVNTTSGAIFVSLALAWVALELVLGPTAKSRIRTTGITVDLPIVKRTRRAQQVLAEIDAAVRATRGGVVEHPGTPASVIQPAQPSVQTISEPSPTVSIAVATQTNGS